MNKTKIEWVKNPDGTQGYTWNPITGCNNQIDGMCQGGNFPCYAYKLANGRLKERYLDNPNVAIPEGVKARDIHDLSPALQAKYGGQDPFYPRFWEDKVDKLYHENPVRSKPKGIFVCDMSDLFGIGIPEEWQDKVFSAIRVNPQHRFYLLTKQPQNLLKFSPFPQNCWVGVTATGNTAFHTAIRHLSQIDAKVKYISIEPLLEPIYAGGLDSVVAREGITITKRKYIDWVIIGAQTKPLKIPPFDRVVEIVRVADKAGIPVFLKKNLNCCEISDYPELLDKQGDMRQELPNA